MCEVTYLLLLFYAYIANWTNFVKNMNYHLCLTSYICFSSTFWSILPQFSHLGFVFVFGFFVSCSLFLRCKMYVASAIKCLSLAITRETYFTKTSFWLKKVGLVVLTVFGDDELSTISLILDTCISLAKHTVSPSRFLL